MRAGRRLRALLDRLEEETTNLRRLSRVPDEELLADPDRRYAVRYGFVLAAEICIDVAEHLIASEGLRAPEDFADCFAALAEGGYLPEDMVPVLADIARFRNLLVHEYARVNDRRVVEILKTRLGDFDAFRATVARSALG